MARKGFMKWNACVDHSDSPARINLVVKVFLYFLIILSPTHNHASLEMSDEPEGLPVRDEIASIVTMLHVTCYVKASLTRHCIIPRKTDPPLRLNGNASFCAISCIGVQGLYDFLYRGTSLLFHLLFLSCRIK